MGNLCKHFATISTTITDDRRENDLHDCDISLFANIISEQNFAHFARRWPQIETNMDYYDNGKYIFMYLSWYIYIEMRFHIKNVYIIYIIRIVVGIKRHI